MVAVVQVSECAVIGAMLGAAVESVLMRASMGAGQMVVEFFMPGVAVVVIVMGKRRHDGGRQQKHCSRYEDLDRSHGVSPLTEANLLIRGSCDRTLSFIALNTAGISASRAIHLMTSSRWSVAVPRRDRTRLVGLHAFFGVETSQARRQALACCLAGRVGKAGLLQGSGYGQELAMNYD
jgi:hypothetical protein